MQAIFEANRRAWRGRCVGTLFMLLGGPALAVAPSPEGRCERTVRADVVALDQAYQVNRLGATHTDGEIYALRADVVSSDPDRTDLRPGTVMLRPDKRARPLVLRVNAGDCLEIAFENLLDPTPKSALQPVTRNAGIHVAGLQPVDTINDDGTWVGQNPEVGGGQMSGLVAPGTSIVYRLYAQAQSTNLLYSTAAQYNNFNEMQLSTGLFGAVNVEPAGSEWYRSQVSAADLALATVGQLPGGHPKLDYAARFPTGHPRAGRPILRMLDETGAIVHSDLTALITGPERGLLPGGPGDNPMLPQRNLPYREVVVIYHESQDAVQAFPYFMSAANSQVPREDAGADTFAINYGIGGIAPQVLANRIGVGPAADCPECKFEEFFLSSWAVGDPALVVDVPANAPCTAAELEALTVKLAADPLHFEPQGACTPRPGRKATLAYYPDDPSNVYHAYLGDHVRFHVLHAGAAVHHIHHHHAHQWLRSPESANSNYLDSQAVGPGSAFTAELVFGGSGNRNLTVGDSIFHCHFYPHFASGMWSLYRVHDVFESGTALDEQGRPQPGARALPDGEIAAGTPIPAIVPLPLYPMAPLPAPLRIVDGQVELSGDGHPGYPFFVPGVAGHRPPHPPLDFAVDPDSGEVHDGGLPRHLVTGARIANEQHTALDWSKDLNRITAYELPEAGTRAERDAMAFFGRHLHQSVTPEGLNAPFKVNGLPRGPQHGAPFADPAVVDGQAVGNPLRRYKGVNLQLDVVFNKTGWHYPQQRMMALWGDVQDYVAGTRAPEPLFFRASTNDVIEYWHTNLVPAYYELDDFQVRTPTDIIGQHIHLVKFDVTSSDGAANGFNYEDGTFSPEEVRERIEAINHAGGLWNAERTQQRKLAPKTIAALGHGPTPGSQAWLGAQATVQRWWLDPLMTMPGEVSDHTRSYMTVFTHDHFGPSTHQMIGLYGGLLIEPAETTWTSLDGKTQFGTRDDGGPTSYAANIVFKAPERQADHYREFALEWGDTQLGYTQYSRPLADCYSYTDPDGKVVTQAPPFFHCVARAPDQPYYGWSDPAHVLNCLNCPPQPLAQPPQSLIANQSGFAPWPPQPLLVSDFGAGMMSMNYRGEPLAPRVNKPQVSNPAAAPDAGDLAAAFRSIARFDPVYSTQPSGGAQIDPTCRGADCLRFPRKPVSPGMGATDPYTPMLMGYEGDHVQIRLLVGAHTSMHDFTMHGRRWLAEPFEPDSGYRSTQFILLSEHYELLFDLPRLGAESASDYLYNPSASFEGLSNGAWGLLRAFNPARPQPFLKPLPTAVSPAAPVDLHRPPAGMTRDCSSGKPCIREFEVHAMTVQQALGQPAGTLVYNRRGVNLGGGSSDTAHPLEDPFGLVYVLVPKGGTWTPRNTVEPLVLRANAGDWIHLTLVNDFLGTEPVFNTPEAASRFGLTYAAPYNGFEITTSARVGLHAQLLDYDVRKADGASAGINPVQTVGPGERTEYWWYAGSIGADGTQTPIEFGSVNLLPADPLMQVYRGLFGALVIEPQGSTWRTDADSAASATVWPGDPDGSVFREFVLFYQNDANMLTNGHSWWATGNPLAGFNYRSEPAWLRFGTQLNAALGSEAPADWTQLTQDDVQNISVLPMSAVNETQTTANSLVGAEPETPIFRAPAGMPARFRLLMPGGDGDNQITWELTGHLWQEEPWQANSTRIGHNPKSDVVTTLTGYGTASVYDVVLDRTPGSTPSGGRFGVPGDYLYRAWTANIFQGGAWGLFRVSPDAGLPAGQYADVVAITAVSPDGRGRGVLVSGHVTPCPQSGADCVRGGFVQQLRVGTPDGALLGRARVDADGRWQLRLGKGLPSVLEVRSPAGGVAQWDRAASAAQPPHLLQPPAPRDLSPLDKRLPRQ